MPKPPIPAKANTSSAPLPVFGNTGGADAPKTDGGVGVGVAVTQLQSVLFGQEGFRQKPS